MGAPHSRKIFRLNLTVNSKSTWDGVIFHRLCKAFLNVVAAVAARFFQTVLVAFSKYEMSRDKNSFVCKYCGNDTIFIWKPRHGMEWLRPFLPESALSHSNNARWNARGGRQKAVPHPGVAWHGAEEEGSRRIPAQVGSDGSVDVLPCIGEVRQDVRVGDRQNDDLEVGATGW